MANPTTSYAEIQQDEIEVLRSIYMEDFVETETKTGAWNVGEMFCFRIRAPVGGIQVCFNIAYVGGCLVYGLI